MPHSNCKDSKNKKLISGLEIGLGLLAVLFPREKVLRREGEFSPTTAERRPDHERCPNTEHGGLRSAAVWNGDLHQKNAWIWGVLGVGKSQWAADQSPMTTTLKKTRDHWDRYSLALTNGVIVEKRLPVGTGRRPAGGGVENLGRPVSLPGRSEGFDDTGGSRQVHVRRHVELFDRAVLRARTRPSRDAKAVLGDCDD
jgi:hypothetical protein